MSRLQAQIDRLGDLIEGADAMREAIAAKEISSRTLLIDADIAQVVGLLPREGEQ